MNNLYFIVVFIEIYIYVNTKCVVWILTEDWCIFEMEVNLANMNVTNTYP